MAYTTAAIIHNNNDSQMHDMAEKPEMKEIPVEYEEAFFNYDDVDFINPSRSRKVDNYYILPQGGNTNVNIAGQQLMFQATETSGFWRFSEAYFIMDFTLKGRPNADAAGGASDVALASDLNVTLENDFFWKLFSSIKLDIISLPIEEFSYVSKV